jgi:branched-chain amino acid transport system permease protein
MLTVLGFNLSPILGQGMLGVVNGAFYALLSLGLSVIFGLLNIVNFAQGALYMLGAVVAWALLNGFGIGYWPSLIIAPSIVGLFAILLERTLIRRLYKLEHHYGLLLTFGVALIIESLARNQWGSSGLPYAVPAELRGVTPLGFMFMPTYRLWVVAASLAICLGTWLVLEKTSLGATLRAATENAALVQAFGVNVPRLVTLTFGAGVALAGLAGVMAAPVYSVNPGMGSDVIIVVFGVVVIGGMGSILGSIITGFGLGLLEGFTKFLYPQGSGMVVFVLMILVLLVRPSGLFGRAI